MPTRSVNLGGANKGNHIHRVRNIDCITRILQQENVLSDQVNGIRSQFL